MRPRAAEPLAAEIGKTPAARYELNDVEVASYEIRPHCQEDVPVNRRPDSDRLFAAISSAADRRRYRGSCRREVWRGLGRWRRPHSRPGPDGRPGWIVEERASPMIVALSMACLPLAQGRSILTTLAEAAGFVAITAKKIESRARSPVPKSNRANVGISP